MDTRDRESSRQRAREEVTKNFYQHEIKQGRLPRYEDVRRNVFERADVLDKKKDWGER